MYIFWHSLPYLLVSWVWWHWPLMWLTDHRPSVLWHWWLHHLICKIVPKMTYNVYSGTLNRTVPMLKTSSSVSRCMYACMCGCSWLAERCHCRGSAASCGSETVQVVWVWWMLQLINTHSLRYISLSVQTRPGVLCGQYKLIQVCIVVSTHL